ncbi:hypothetical protein ACIPWB_28165 [[Kitasatospora] papulosa]|uniref:hypothetical protein n=1 Tax=[Kitasatospora] papulosa TaxID=1464011 RepID=UPI0038093320
MPAPFERPVIRQRNLAMLLLGLAGNPSAPPEALVRLAAANIDRTELARRRDLPARAAVILADDKDANLRSELAANPNLPAEVQIVLARDVDAQVRGRLAEGAEYFTTVGVHARRFPGPLSDDVYERLAQDPEPKVRRALAFNRHLPDDIRARMLDDDDARTAAIAAAEWNPAPTARISELLSRATGAFGRELLLLRLDGPLPAEAVRGMLADIDSRDDFRGIGSLVGVGEPLRSGSVSHCVIRLMKRAICTAPSVRTAVSATSSSGVPSRSAASPWRPRA